MNDSERLDLIRGTLDVLLLKAVVWGPAHGYAIVRRIQAHSEDVLMVLEGALYPALHRLERRGWLASEWGLSEKNRKAKFYSLTSKGRAELTRQTQTWHRYSKAISRVLDAPA